MKSMISMILLLASIVCSEFGQAATATPVAPLPQISSLSALKAWAGEQVRGGYGGVYSNSQVPSAGEITYTDVSGSSMEDVLSTLATTRYKMRVVDRHDGIGAYAGLLNKDGQALFYGGGQAMIDENWKVGETSVELRLADQVPIPTAGIGSGITKVYVIYRDDDGNFIWDEGIGYWDGYVYFPSEYAGKNGQIVFQIGSNSAVVIGLDGQVLSTPQIDFGADYHMDNFGVFDDTKGFMGYVLMYASAGGQHTPPVIKVRLASRRSLTLNCRVIDINTGATIELPSSGRFRKEGESTEYPWQKSGTSFDVILDPGVYYLWWDTTSFDQSPTPPWAGWGEKG